MFVEPKLWKKSRFFHNQIFVGDCPLVNPEIFRGSPILTADVKRTCPTIFSIDGWQDKYFFGKSTKAHYFWNWWRMTLCAAQFDLLGNFHQKSFNLSLALRIKIQYGRTFGDMCDLNLEVGPNFRTQYGIGLILIWKMLLSAILCMILKRDEFGRPKIIVVLIPLPLMFYCISK